MSGIYIPGMEMPDRCFSCPMCDTDCCGISRGSYIEYREVDVDVAMNGRPDWCPLVPVPEHGRLIDADALELDAQKRLLICNKYDNQFQRSYEVIRAIALATTIIPADKEVEG